jgi:hypothetical protein
MTIIGHADTRRILVDGEVLDPTRSQRLRNQSPDGFNWGYGGSGPAQLALAILLAAGVPRRRAIRLYQEFKWAIIARLPPRSDFVFELDVVEWARRHDTTSR